MTKSLPMCRFLLQHPLSLSRFGISVAMWKIAVQKSVCSGLLGKELACLTLLLTLHDVVVPAVGELPVIAVLVQPSEEDLVGVAVLQVD